MFLKWLALKRISNYYILHSVITLLNEPINSLILVMQLLVVVLNYHYIHHIQSPKCKLHNVQAVLLLKLWPTEFYCFDSIGQVHGQKKYYGKDVP